MDIPAGGIGSGNGASIPMNGQAPNPNTDMSYNIPGVLHFVKSEWIRFERERTGWELERAELQSKIAFLSGQKKGHDNLKRDLIRRIKMLEFALKQERSKNHKLVHGTELILPENRIEFEAEPDIVSSSSRLTEGRTILRQYLRELGYTEGVLEARAKVRNIHTYPDTPPADSEVVYLQQDTQDTDNLLDDTKGETEGVQSDPVTTFGEEYPPRPCRPDQRNDDDIGETTTLPAAAQPGDQDVAEVLEQFSFLKNQEGGNSDDDGSSADDEDEASFERSKETKKLKTMLNTLTPDNVAQVQNTADLSPTSEKSAEESRWSEGLLPGEMESMKDQLRKSTEARKMKKNRPSREELSTMRTVFQEGEEIFDSETRTDQPLLSSDPAGSQGGEVTSQDSPTSQEAFQPFQGLGDATKDKDLYGPLAMISVKGGLDLDTGFGDDTRQMWEHRFSLQSHYDSVTSLEFHPSEAFLLTASEDNTVKLWNFDVKGGMGGNKKAGVVDLEPVHTFRGHESAVISLAISKLTPKFYTGDVSGNICTWNLNTSLAPYDEFDPQLLEETTVGHQNAIWDLVVHPTQDLLISAGADGVCKLWKPFNVAEFIMGEEGNNFQPTSLCIIASDPNLLAVSYSNARCAIFDINTEKLVTTLKSYASYDGTVGTQINRIASHPTAPILVTAHEDKQVSFFDHKSGDLIHSMIAHQDAVTGLDIDPQGLFAITSGHDRSLRIWDFQSKSCIQEISTHWSKFDQGVMDVRFHPVQPYFASGGADSLAKIFMKRKD